MKFRLFLLLFSLTQVAGAQTWKHIPVKGTKYYIIPPPGFEHAPGFTGFRQPETRATIMLTVVEVSYAAMVEAFNIDTLSAKGMELVYKREVALAQGKGTLLKVGHRSAGSNERKLILLFGGAQKTVMITGVYAKSDYELEESIKSALLSAFYDNRLNDDRLETIDFSLLVSPAHFRLTRAVNGSLYYTRDGVLPSETSYLVAGAVGGNAAIPDKKQFSLDRLSRLSDGERLSAKEIAEVSIDGLSGYEIVADGKNGAAGNEQVYQVTLFEPGGTYYHITGIAVEDQVAALSQFRTIARTFRKGSFLKRQKIDPVDTMHAYLDSNDRETTVAQAVYYRKLWKGDKHWMSKMYFISGSPFRSVAYSDDSLKRMEGTFTEWFSDGSVARIDHYSAGKREGASLRWYTDGQLADSAYYVHDSLDGGQVWFHKNGLKSEEGTYKMGVPVDIKLWTSDGRPDTGGHANILMPKFADSGKELLDFLANTLKYPVFSRNHGRVGRVIMQFVVGEDGRISRIAVVKSSGTLELDQQALRVVRLMPVWKPGKNHNRPAEMYFTMPVTFTLD